MTEEESIEPLMDDTDVDIEDATVKVIDTPVYEFTIRERLTPDYGMAYQIIEWLQTNLSSLKDDYNKVIFGKVNTGFNENLLKTFGKKPVCDVYIKNVEYTGDFDNHIPTKLHSIVLFYMKGANNKTYVKACELHDLLMQEFISNHSFRELDNVVQDTYIDNSEIRIQTLRGGMGVMGAFELTHTLY